VAVEQRVWRASNRGQTGTSNHVQEGVRVAGRIVRAEGVLLQGTADSGVEVGEAWGRVLALLALRLPEDVMTWRLVMGTTAAVVHLLQRFAVGGSG